MNGVKPSEIAWRPMPRVLDSAPASSIGSAHAPSISHCYATFSKISVCMVHHVAMDYAAHTRKQVTTTSKGFIAALVRHSWPGKSGIARLQLNSR
jgi:hypothetical protein